MTCDDNDDDDDGVVRVASLSRDRTCGFLWKSRGKEARGGKAWADKPPAAIIARFTVVQFTGKRAVFFLSIGENTMIAIDNCRVLWSRSRVMIVASYQTTTIYTAAKKSLPIIPRFLCDKESPERESVRLGEQSIFQPEICSDWPM